MAQPIESDVDAALGAGMDQECMRICGIIDEMVAASGSTGYAKAQKRALLKLKERILEIP